MVFCARSVASQLISPEFEGIKTFVDAHDLSPVAN